MSKLAVVSAVGIGSIGIGGFGAYNFGTFVSNIRYTKDRLEESQYILLSPAGNKHRSYWTKSLKEYKKKHPNNSSLGEEGLKAICKRALDSEYQNNNSYEEARRYCVIPRKIAERLKDLGISTLNMAGGTDELEWKWLTFEYNYIGTGKRKLGTLEKDTVKDYQKNWILLRDECKKELIKDHWAENYHLILEKVKRWCTALPT